MLNQTFKLNDNHSIEAAYDFKIRVVIRDPRVPDNVFEAELELKDYNDLVDFFKVNDHQFAINMAKAKFGIK